MRDELFEASASCFFLFGAHYPSGYAPPVGGRLRLEKAPRSVVRLEPPLRRGIEFLRLAFVQVNLRASGIAGFVRLRPRRMHSSCACQLRDAPHVHHAPDAASLPRRETDRITQVVTPLSNTVDPAKAESFVERLLVGDSAASASGLVKREQEFLC